jgi:response regulator of citrate/malate metabolism
MASGNGAFSTFASLHPANQVSATMEISSLTAKRYLRVPKKSKALGWTVQRFNPVQPFN